MYRLDKVQFYKKSGNKVHKLFENSNTYVTNSDTVMVAVKVLGADWQSSENGLFKTLKKLRFYCLRPLLILGVLGTEDFSTSFVTRNLFAYVNVWSGSF